MPDPTCPLCRLFGDLEHALVPMDDLLRRLKTANALWCFCGDDRRHRPLVAHPHTKPGCIGYAPPDIEIVGTVDTWDEEHAHAVE